MPIFTSVNEALAQRGVSLRVRVEVLADDGITWVDLTDRIGADRLEGLPGLSARQERGLGAAEVAVSSITVDNRDRYWDKTPPAGIGRWFRHKVRISIVTAGGTQAIGTWLIDDLETISDSPTATLSVAQLSKRLVDKEADRVRNGRDWYTNRPVGFLVRELLAAEFLRSEVQSWNGILTRYAVPLSDASARALSFFGRPPEWDGVVWREDSLSVYGNPMLAINDVSHADYGKILVGIEADLWLWDPAADLWTRVGGFSGAQAAFKIMHLYWNPVAHRYVGVGWEPDRPTTNVTGDRSGAKSGAVKFFWGDRASNPFTLFTSEPANVFTGHYSVRAGATGGGNTRCGAPGSGSPDANCAGTNVPLPAGHWLRWKWETQSGPTYTTDLKHKAAWNSKTDTTDQGNGSADATYWGVDSAGYLAPFDLFSTYPMDFRFSIGQFAGAFAMEPAGAKLAFCVIRWDGAAGIYKYRLYKLDTGTSTFLDTGFDLANGSTVHPQPTCMTFSPDGSKLVVGGVEWKETAWAAGAPPANAMNGWIIEYTWGTPAWSKNLFAGSSLIDGTDPPATWAPLQLLYPHASATRYLYATWFDYKQVGGPAWAFSIGDLGTAGDTYFDRWADPATHTFRPSFGRQAGLVWDTTKDRVYWQDAGANALLSVPGASAGTAKPSIVAEDYGFPPVPNDGALAAGLVYGKKLEALFGLSGAGAAAQSNPEILDGPLAGKFYLWQFANSLTDRIEVADFSQMKLWDALEQLATVINGVFGFDATGAFYFKGRPAPTSTLATIRASGAVLTGEIPTNTIRKQAGYRELVNYAEMTPSIATLGQPKGTIRVLPRPATLGRAAWDIEPQVFQANNRNLSLLLRCVQGSQVGSPDDGALAQDAAGNVCVDYNVSGAQRIHRLRFAFLLYDSVVETQLLAAVAPTDDTILVPIQAVKDVQGSAILDVDAYKQTDGVLVGDNLLEITVRSRTDDLPNGRSSLRLQATIGKAYPVGTKVMIRTRGNNRWSDAADGLTLYYDTLGIPSPGTLQTMAVMQTREMMPGMILRFMDVFEEMRVQSVVDATHVKVYRGAGGTTPAVHQPRTPILGYWAPIQNTLWPAGSRWPIGSTGVSLRFLLPTGPENPFLVGDQIEIVCPGLTLEAQEKAKQIALNTASIADVGKIPWDAARESRFAGYRPCLEITRRIVNDFGVPHDILIAEGPLARLPDFNEAYLVCDPLGTLPIPSAGASPNGDTPPVAPDTTQGIAAVVRAYTCDLLNDRLSLEMRAVNPHAG